MTIVLVIGRNGAFCSVNQKWHFALVGWWRVHWGRS